MDLASPLSGSSMMDLESVGLTSTNGEQQQKQEQQLLHDGTSAEHIPDGDYSSRPSQCLQHPDYELSRFCTVCKLPVCSRCVKKEHASCAHIPIHKGVAHQKTFLEASLVEANTHLDYIHQRFDDLALMLANEHQQMANMQQLVELEFQKIASAVEERKQILFAKVQQTFSQRRAKLDRLKSTLSCKEQNLRQGKMCVESILRRDDDKDILESQHSYDKFMRTYFLDNNDFHPASDDLLQFVSYRREKLLKEISQFGHVVHSPVKPQNSTFSVGFHQICTVHDDVVVPVVLRDRDNREIHLDQEIDLDPKDYSVSIVSPYENTHHARLELNDAYAECEKKKLLLKYGFDLAGTYDLSVRILGEHIKGSPFTIKAAEQNPAEAGATRHHRLDSSDHQQRSTRFVKPKVSSMSPRRKMVPTRSLSNLRHSAASATDQKSVSRRSVRMAYATSASRAATPTALSSAQSGAFLTDDLRFKVGGHGRNKGQFTNPQGACFAKFSRRICICDSNNACIQVFKEDGGFCFRFGQRGRESGQLLRPIDIAETQQGNLVVSDFDNHCVNVFSKEGRYLTRFGQKTLIAPKGIAVDKENRIVVVDNKSCCVCVFKSTGKFLFKFGCRGNADHQLAGAHYIAVNSQNHYLVTDFHNHAVKAYDGNGTFLFIFGQHGIHNGLFHSPTGITVDEKDRIVVADWGNARIQMFDAVGNFLNVINSNADPVYGPQGVTVLNENSILVVDSGNHCFKVYEYPLL